VEKRQNRLRKKNPEAAARRRLLDDVEQRWIAVGRQRLQTLKQHCNAGHEQASNGKSSWQHESKQEANTP
jgi:hypothetical protein